LAIRPLNFRQLLVLRLIDGQLLSITLEADDGDDREYDENHGNDGKSFFHRMTLQAI
jgi:hypothetical protein